MSNFLDFVVEQGFIGEAFRLLAYALVFATVVAVVSIVASRRRGRPLARAFVLATTLAVAAFAAAVIAFEAAAQYLRFVPHGSGFERRCHDHAAFVAHAKVSFVALYVGALVVAAVVGWLLAHALRVRSGRVAVLTTAATASFMLPSLPAVEFMNACKVGEPFVLSPRC